MTSAGFSDSFTTSVVGGQRGECAASTAFVGPAPGEVGLVLRSLDLTVARLKLSGPPHELAGSWSCGDARGIVHDAAIGVVDEADV